MSSGISLNEIEFIEDWSGKKTGKGRKPTPRILSLLSQLGIQ